MLCVCICGTRKTIFNVFFSHLVHTASSLFCQSQLTAVEDVKAIMEQPGQQEGLVTPAAEPQVEPEVSAAPEGSKPVPGNSGELLITTVGSSRKENEREAEEQEGAELDSALSESGEKGELGTDPQSQADGNTSCDSGTASMDDARTPTGPPDVSPECFPTAVSETAESSPVCLIQESSPAVLDGVEELSPVALDEIVECSPVVLDGALEPSPAILCGTNTSSPTGLDGATELSPANQDGITELTPTEGKSEATVPVTQVANGPSSSTTAITPVSPHSSGDQSPSTPPDSASTSGTSSPQTPTPTPKTSAPNANSDSSSPYDTDCSRRLMSEIQRTLSQESLLDELESELLSCQLPGEAGSGNGGAPTNGIPKDPSSMMVFEKCVQYKYSQQEKAIKK